MLAIEKIMFTFYAADTGRQRQSRHRFQRDRYPTMGDSNCTKKYPNDISLMLLMKKSCKHFMSAAPLGNVGPGADSDELRTRRWQVRILLKKTPQ